MTLDELEADGREILRYVDNPNGSLRDIAGICNEGRNVMGMMPHPERASDLLLGLGGFAVTLDAVWSARLAMGLRGIGRGSWIAAAKSPAACILHLVHVRGAALAIFARGVVHAAGTRVVSSRKFFARLEKQ